LLFKEVCNDGSGKHEHGKILQDLSRFCPLQFICNVRIKKGVVLGSRAPSEAGAKRGARIQRTAPFKVLTNVGWFITFTKNLQ
jgi:hypothetical protein